MMKITALIFFGFAPSVFAMFSTGDKRLQAGRKFSSRRLVTDDVPFVRAGYQIHDGKLKFLLTRHGQSRWNAWKVPLAGAAFGAIHDWVWGGVLHDASLTKKGVGQAVKRIKGNMDGINGNLEEAGLRFDIEDMAKAGKVMFVASNLRRAIETLMVGFQDVFRTLSEEHQKPKVHIFSALQEITRGPDASCSRSPGMNPYPGPETVASYGDSLYETVTFNMDHDKQNNNADARENKELQKERIAEFLDACFLQKQETDIDLVIAAGHSHQFLNMLQLLSGDPKFAIHLKNGQGAVVTIEKSNGRYQLVANVPGTDGDLTIVN